VRPADEVAWEEFVRRFHGAIRINVQKTFARKAREELDRKEQFPEDAVEDLVQAVYFRLIEDRSRALIKFEGEHLNSIYQYLAMISVNVVRDYFREMKAQKRPKLSHSLEEILDSGHHDFPSQESAGGIGDIYGQIETALRKSVSGKNRDRDMLIFKLHYFDGLNSEEIIRVMKLDISTIGVNSILSRIVKRMKSYISLSG
jgi:RNA polymerase sigma factor (sigma-70 family)